MHESAARPQYNRNRYYAIVTPQLPEESRRLGRIIVDGVNETPANLDHKASRSAGDITGRRDRGPMKPGGNNFCGFIRRYSGEFAPGPTRSARPNSFSMERRGGFIRVVISLMILNFPATLRYV